MEINNSVWVAFTGEERIHYEEGIILSRVSSIDEMNFVIITCPTCRENEINS